MTGPVIECVANFSEGRDQGTVDAIVNAIVATPGVRLLGSESDPDHNRSVVTFAGAPDAVVTGAFQGIRQAVETIDLNRHDGVHPRVGAADVVPFVPIRGITLEECAALAHRLGQEVWDSLRVPVYFYEAAALRPERVRLENIRNGGFGWLLSHAAEERPPDVGGPGIHPTAGATVIGARKLLIAFNINLSTDDVVVAQRIAAKVRQSSGGLPTVKAIGVYLASRGLAQVSLNLTDFDRAGIHQAYEAVRLEAERLGVGIAGTQIIGLVPRRALERSAAEFVHCENFSESRVLEHQIELERRLPTSGVSASAWAGAVAASLGHMVALRSGRPTESFAQHEEYFSTSSDAFEITERARLLDRDLLGLMESSPAQFRPDLTAALALARASRAGGIAAGKLIIEGVQDVALRRRLEDQLNRRPSSE